MTTIKNTIDKFGRRRGGDGRTVIRGPPGVGFKLTPDKQFDIQYKRLKNIGDPIDQTDGVTRMYVDELMQERFDAYSKFIHKKITDLVDTVRQNINKEVETVKREQDTLVTRVAKVEQSVEESFPNKIAAVVVESHPNKIAAVSNTSTKGLEKIEKIWLAA